MDVVSSLLLKLNRVPVGWFEEDKSIWWLTRDRGFSVKFFYEYLQEREAILHRLFALQSQL